MITVINLGIGNITSVSRALRYLGVQHAVSNRPDEVERAGKLILPGVGSFFEAAARMSALGLDAVLKDKVLNKNTPILGICLGMQLFATSGDEGGGSMGLDFIKGKATMLRSAEWGLPLPHIGWNDVRHSAFKIFDSITSDHCFYFIHSYTLSVHEPVTAVAYSNYGVDFIAAVQKRNIIGVQFHPEKSHRPGLEVLKNFCEGIF